MEVNNRQVRGLELAATRKIRQSGNAWRVPSQSHESAYLVYLAEGRCTCPDHETRGVKCKHIFAVEYVIEREAVADGTLRETETVKVTRVTYRQNWTAYNAAQTEEKSRFTALLSDLCAMVPQPEQTKGRPRLPLSDMVFASAYKTYTGFSSRRFTSDLREARDAGHIASIPHFNSVTGYLASPDLTPVLQSLIEISSLPLRTIETDFAVDSSGFSTCRFVRWFNKKYGHNIDAREWVKVHLICGVKTNIVTGVEVSDWTAHDSPFFPALVEGTARNFQMAEVSADKAYLSRANVATVARVGAVPFIPLKSNTTLSPTDDSVWTKMYHFYAMNRSAFLASYHKRSNVETVFSMIKGKFGSAVRGKTDTAQFNEVLAKVLCHNICVLIQSIHELGIEPAFDVLPEATSA